jgi:hypothetical protein
MHQRKVIDVMANSVPYTRWIPLGLLIFGPFAAIALAQQSNDPMEVCSGMSAPEARLACFDNEMRRRHASAARGPTGAAGAPPAAVAPVAQVAMSAPALTSATPSGTAAKQTPPDDTIGLDGRALMLKRKEEGIQPEAVKPMVEVIAKLTPRPGHLYYFELENGQVWESTDTEPDLFLGPHETVVIRPGILGAFFLKTKEGTSIRVHRLR